MIENRHRIENEVLLGRQAVRRASRNKDKTREVAKPHSGSLIPSISGTGPFQDGADTGPVPTTSEAPMSMDTDAEDAFKKGSRWFFKRDASKSGSSTPRDRETELRDTGHPNGVAPQHIAWRGSWSSFFHTQGANHPPTPPQQTIAESTQQQDGITPQEMAPPSSPSLFNRIRRKSILSSPFNTLRRPAAKVTSRPGSEYSVRDTQGTWSSDTSSDEDLRSPEWRESKLPQFPSLVGFEDDDDALILSSQDDEAGGDGNTSLDVVGGGVKQDS